MTVYELRHLFFRCNNDIVCSTKCLGFYLSFESANQTLQHYYAKPGFSDNQDAFSIQERAISGRVSNKVIYEVILYLHTKDYEFETEIELGLYGSEVYAQDVLLRYCENNMWLMQAEDLIVEKIINKRVLDQKEWTEGFIVFE